MYRLAIDTSSPISSVAIIDGDGQCRLRESPSRDSHSQSLASMVQGVALDAGIRSFSEFSEIVIGLGPGSFTGLRIGLSYAKGVSLAHRIPLTGLSSFAAMAMVGAVEGQIVAVLGDARRGEYFFTVFERQRASVDELHPLVIASAEVVNQFLAQNFDGREIVCLDAGNEDLSAISLRTVSVNSIAQGLAQLPAVKATWSIQAISEISPLYTRGVAALTVAERTAQLSSVGGNVQQK